MKTFHCQFCGHPIFFENIQCLKCGSTLGFLPDRMSMAAVEPVPDAGTAPAPAADGTAPAAPAAGALWRPRMRGKRASSARYRLCSNSAQYQACNFMVPEADANPLCASCRLTRVLPDLTQPENQQRWYRIEVAKRRLFYTLAKLGMLDPSPADGQVDGPVFEFLADQPGQPVMTGHCGGLITLNVVEADDAERVARRVALHEPYRTLLGHMRHESGHYYWDRLIADANRHEEFRALFGDERQDYSQALDHHYANGPNPNWRECCVSAYATSHPWEDWAETWAHYLHMVDLLETAASYNTRLSVGGDEDDVEEVTNPFETGLPDFAALVEQWVPVTLLVNSLNRSLGQEDAYPFALSPAALDKLRYVHDVIRDVKAHGMPKRDTSNDEQACNVEPASGTAPAPGAAPATPASA